MDAEEAKRLTDAKNAQLSKQQMIRIHANIKKAIDSGRTGIMIHESIREDNLEWLHENGYKAQMYGGRLGESNYWVSWKKPYTSK